MQEKRIHRLVVRVALVVLAVSSVLFIYSATQFFKLSTSETINFWIIVYSGVFSIFSLTALISAYAIKYREKRWIKIASKSSLFLVPLFIFLIGLRGATSGDLSIASVLLLIIFTYILLTYIYLYTKATALAGTIVFLIIMLLGMYLKRNHFMFSGFAMVIGCGMLSLGSFMFAIRCLYLSENRAYFRGITFFGGIILSFSFLGFMFKLQHWPGAGPLLMTGLVLLILGTVFLLFTLHSSGIIEWSSSLKRIFVKILIPWTFIFFMYFSRFLIPDLYDIIWSPDPKKRNIQTTTTIPGFGMKDYEIERKNGLNTLPD